MSSVEWCGNCQDHYDVEHHDENGHKVGPEFGPTGLEMWKLREIRALATGSMSDGIWGSIYSEQILAILDTAEPR